MSDGPKDPSAASGLEAGMASLTFTALNEPSAENPGQGNHGTEEGNKKDRRRTASLERYRPAAKFAENSEEKAAERANHRQRLGFGQSRLQGNSGGGPEGGQRGGKGGGQRGNRERRNKGNRRGGGNKHPDQYAGSGGGGGDPYDQNGGSDDPPQSNYDFQRQNSLATATEQDNQKMGEKNWADYSFDDDTPIDPPPPVADHHHHPAGPSSQDHHETNSSGSRPDRKHRSPKSGGGGRVSGGWAPRNSQAQPHGAGNNENNGHGHQEDLRNKLNRNKNRSAQGQHHVGGGSNGLSQFEQFSNNSIHNTAHSFNNSGTGKKPLPRPKKNTENFNPCHEPPEMRILCAPPGLSRCPRAYSTRDVAVVTDLFVQDVNDYRIYHQLLEEIQKSGVDERLLWQSWHGDSHLIADDKRQWKKHCPTFAWVVDKLADYFDMNVQATRLNWYRDTNEWKPFHHDAAAVKPDKARTQNMTVAVSFGAERDAAFEHAKTKTVISMPQPNGTVYTFGRDVNILWRHGIPQVHPDFFREEGRISIICWGKMDMFDM